ncbi:MAG: response regulator [Candidatus Binatia bacterium]
MPKYKILIIEDHAVTRKNIARLLQTEGFEVLLAADGYEALDLIDSLPDLVVTDFVMPGLGGGELLRRLRSRAALTPIILISATATEEITHEIQHCEINDHIVKPFDLDDLLGRIQSVLTARSIPS